MTRDELNAKAARQVTALIPWNERATARIESRFSDVHAHAAKAITDTLRATPDGRATIRKASASRSTVAATGRLDGLLGKLAGGTVASLDGLLRDAREAFYVAAFEEWKAFVPESLWVSPDPSPTQANIRAIRRAVLHGMDLRTEVAGPIDRAKRTLVSSLTLAGRRAADGKESSTILETWRIQNEKAVVAAVLRALSDGQMAADVQAGRDLVHPDHLDPL